jgi:hypothetical protein
MADLKKRTLHLSSGKQINLFGNSLAIGKSLEIGEGGAHQTFCRFCSSSRRIKIPSACSIRID